MEKIGFWLLIVSLFTSGAIFADQTIKELEKKLQEVSGREKIDVLNKLSYAYSNKSPGKVLEYGKRALQLSQKIGDKNGEATALRNIGIGYAISGKAEDSLKCARESLEIFKKLGNKRETANSTGVIGTIYLKTGSYDKALEYLLETLKIKKQLGDKNDKNISGTLGNIGSVYSRLGNYEKALEYQLKALRIREEFGDKQGIAAAINNIGSIYARLYNYDRSLGYYKRSLVIKKEIGDKIGIAHTLENIGVVYNDLGHYEKALEYHLESLEKREEIGDIINFFSPYLNIGNTYRGLNNYKKALEYYTKALKIGEDINDPDMISGASINIGSMYLKMRVYNKALTSLQKGIKLAKEINKKETIKEAYFNLSELFAAKGDFKNALEYFKLYSQAKDEILNEKKSKQIAEMQSRYEALKKDKEIEILKKDKEIQKVNLSRQRNARNVSILVSILLLYIFFQFFRKYRYLFSFWKKKNYISHYRLLDKISSGGMGDIYMARDIQGKPRVAACAIKILKEEYYKDENYRKRFKNEAAIIDQLQHPNIVKVMERGEFEGNLYIAMEFLEGTTLSGLIEKGTEIELKTALIIMIQIADAVVEIHKRGIIHRDLKPENIMVVQTGDNPFFVKVLDFGLARTQNLSRLTRSGMIMGTIFYVSPEQLSGSKVLPAGDIYSLGVIYYQLLTGEKPFDGDTAFHIARQILKKEPVAIEKYQPGIPQGLSILIKKMMAKKPRQRPAVKEVYKALKDIDQSL